MSLNEMTDTRKDDGAKHWYVMRDLKRPNSKMPAWRMLGDKGIEVFTPMKTHVIVTDGKPRCEQVPFIRDLLFVHDARPAVDYIVRRTPTLQYRYKRGCGYCVPMTVADADMERFIHAVRASDNPQYYMPDEITSALCGRMVRIVGGCLDGYTGRLLDVRGSRTKRLLIDMSGMFFVGVEVTAGYVQIL